MDNRTEMTRDQRERSISTLIESYRSLLEQEKAARSNRDEHHLKACLAGQQRVLNRLARLGVTASNIRRQAAENQADDSKTDHRVNHDEVDEVQNPYDDVYELPLETPFARRAKVL